jgi:hypothetical protein
MSRVKKDINKPIIKGNKRALFKAFEIEQDKDNPIVAKECSNIKDPGKKTKFLITPIGRNNKDARNHFRFELETDQLPMRWSTNDYGIPYDTKYIGFVFYDANEVKILAIYYVLQILPPGFMYRKEWTDDVYRRRQTVLIGDLKNVMKYETYCNYYGYKSEFLPRMNQLRDISHELLEMTDKSITDNNYLFGGSGSVKKNGQSVTNRIKNYIRKTGDRYEISFKEFIDGEFAEIGFIHNKELKMLDGQRRRPDFHKKFKYMTIIIEYDERNHTDRNIEDEIKRMNQLRDHFRPEKITIIRYGNKFNSWDAAKKCVLCIMKTIYLAMNGDEELCKIFNKDAVGSKVIKQLPIQKTKVYKTKTTDEITDTSVEEVEESDDVSIPTTSTPTKCDDIYITKLLTDKIILFGYPNNPYGNLDNWVVEVE